MRHALTLVELLCVLAIVALVAGVATPAVQTVLRLATATRCASNLRQVGMATLAYAQDWNDLLPAEGHLGVLDPARSPAWFVRLPPYLELPDALRRTSVFQCAGHRGAAAEVFDNAMPKSFKMNAYLDADGRPRHYPLGWARDQSEVVLFVDAVAGETGMGQWGHAPRSAVDDSRHPGRINALCLDGHAQRIGRKDADDPASGLRWVSEDWGR